MSNKDIQPPSEGLGKRRRISGPGFVDVRAPRVGAGDDPSEPITGGGQQPLPTEKSGLGVPQERRP